MTEKGMKEGLVAVEKKLADRKTRTVRAHEAAGVTAMTKLLDRVKPDIPVRTGELRGSGFVDRTNPIEGGWGADHAETVHELDGGRGFKFHQKTSVGFDLVGEQAKYVEAYADAGLTLETVPSSYPSQAPPPRSSRRGRPPADRTRPRGMGRRR